MARPGISFEDVKSAAVALLARGLNPSIQRVRELLGTGSNSTIGEHLKRWQQELAEAPKSTLPPGVPEAVMAALDSFWQVAVDHAEAAFQELRTKALQAVEAAEQARDEATAGMRQARSEAMALEQCLHETQAAAKELGDNLLVERERRHAAEAAIKTADQRAIEATRLTDQIRAEAGSRVAKLEEALRQSREDAERRLSESEQRLHYERERGEANEARLMQLIDQARVELTNERHALSTERETWQSREKNLQLQVETNQENLGNMRLTLARLEERERLQETELSQARTTLRELGDRYVETVRAAEQLRAELKAADTERQLWKEQFENCLKRAKDSADTPPA